MFYKEATTSFRLFLYSSCCILIPGFYHELIFLGPVNHWGTPENVTPRDIPLFLFIVDWIHFLSIPWLQLNKENRFSGKMLQWTLVQQVRFQALTSLDHSRPCAAIFCRFMSELQCSPLDWTFLWKGKHPTRRNPWDRGNSEVQKRIGCELVS